MVNLNPTEKLGKEEKKRKIGSYIKSNKNIPAILGNITDLKQVGQGGNGLVYSGKQNGKEVAVKFLIEDSQLSKLERFKAEYFNVHLIKDKTHIVNYINYEEIVLEEVVIPAIIMKKYEMSLREFRKNTPVKEKDLKELFRFLIKSLNIIHKNGIIHRDIKPENILVSKESGFVLTDFGIANYNPELYKLKAETQKKERLANYEFSAPEQTRKGVKPSPTMDIYALGQVCHWYVFGETHRGTKRRRITEVFETETAVIIEKVIDKCLNNDPEQRYQTVEEVIEDVKSIKESMRVVDPFEDMNELNDVIRATLPSVSSGLKFVEEEKYIKRFVENINKKNFNHKLWFNTGIGNSDFKKIKYLGDKIILIDSREIKVKGIWFYTNSTYDDLIMIETEELEPFKINGDETYHALLLDNKHLVPAHYQSSGYIEIDDQVYNLNDFEVEERDRYRPYKYYFIGTMYHCTVLAKNDFILDAFQEYGVTNEKLLLQLIRKLRINKHDEVVMRL